MLSFINMTSLSVECVKSSSGRKMTEEELEDLIDQLPLRSMPAIFSEEFFDEVDGQLKADGDTYSLLSTLPGGDMELARHLAWVRWDYGRRPLREWTVAELELIAVDREIPISVLDRYKSKSLIRSAWKHLLLRWTEWMPSIFGCDINRLETICNRCPWGEDDVKRLLKIRNDKRGTVDPVSASSLVISQWNYKDLLRAYGAYTLSMLHLEYFDRSYETSVLFSERNRNLPKESLLSKDKVVFVLTGRYPGMSLKGKTQSSKVNDIAVLNKHFRGFVFKGYKIFFQGYLVSVDDGDWKETVLNAFFNAIRVIDLPSPYVQKELNTSMSKPLTIDPIVVNSIIKRLSDPGRTVLYYVAKEMAAVMSNIIMIKREVKFPIADRHTMEMASCLRVPVYLEYSTKSMYPVGDFKIRLLQCDMSGENWCESQGCVSYGQSVFFCMNVPDVNLSVRVERRPTFQCPIPYNIHGDVEMYKIHGVNPSKTRYSKLFSCLRDSWTVIQVYPPRKGLAWFTVVTDDKKWCSFPFYCSSPSWAVFETDVAKMRGTLTDPIVQVRDFSLHWNELTSTMMKKIAITSPRVEMNAKIYHDRNTTFFSRDELHKRFDLHEDEWGDFQGLTISELSTNISHRWRGHDDMPDLVQENDQEEVSDSFPSEFGYSYYDYAEDDEYMPDLVPESD